MDDDELEKLREQKREELQDQSSEDVEEQLEQQKQSIWNEARQYMTSEARSRLANIKTVKEDLALAVARQVSQLGKSGQIDKVTDDKMKQILKSLQNQKEGSESNIKFRR